MTARRLGYLAAIVTVAASGTYFFVYLTRWEWNRALTSGVILLAAEIALFGALALDRIAALRRSQASAAHERRDSRPQTLARLRDSAPPYRNRFAWLRPDTTNVFVPILLGAGVVVSAIAWVTERVGRATAGRSMERGLATRLDSLEPPHALISPESDPFALFAPAQGRSS